VLRRFLGSQAGRKARYAALFVQEIDPGQVPEPLTAVLARAATTPGRGGWPAGSRGW